MIKRIRPGIFGILLAAIFIMPDYPNANKVFEHESVINGIRIKLAAYKTQDSIPKVVAFYKDALRYEFEIKEGNEQQNIIIFRDKEGKSVNLSCSRNSVDNYTTIQLAYTLNAVSAANTEGEDVPGDEVFWLRRYPDSIRTMYMKTGDGFTAVYEAKTNCLQCLVDFYRKELTGWGWRLVHERKTGFKPHKGNEQGLSKDDAAKLGKYEEAIAKNKELMQDNYLLAFEKVSERCEVVVSLVGSKARAVVQYAPY